MVHHSVYTTPTSLFSQLAFIAVAMNFRDRCEIIGLHKISHFIKQPSSSVCLKKVLEMRIKVAETTQYLG